VELPDGKVLSGTESGYLLMWDGNFIQFQVAKPGKQPCHQVHIHYPYPCIIIEAYLIWYAHVMDVQTGRY
jgi:hypothetical protein